MPGKHEIKEVQKTAILGTSHLIRKVLVGTVMDLRVPKIRGIS